jgi:GxxExxY protein
MSALPVTVRECAEDVQAELGPNLRENAYHEALLVALSNEGVQATSEATIPVLYRGFPVARMHPDLIVGSDERYILELKVDRDGTAQLRTYLDYAARNDMDDIVGGLMFSFGDGLEVNEV